MFEIIKNNRGLNNIESLFDNFFNDSFFNHSINSLDYYLSEDDKKYFIEFALPGIDKKEINLNINGSYLYLSYEAKVDSVDSFGSKSFSRRIKLPNNINRDTIKASLKNGVLTIDLEKDVSEIESKKIEIK